MTEENFYFESENFNLEDEYPNFDIEICDYQRLSQEPRKEIFGSEIGANNFLKDNDNLIF